MYLLVTHLLSNPERVSLQMNLPLVFGNHHDYLLTPRDSRKRMRNERQESKKRRLCSFRDDEDDCCSKHEPDIDDEEDVFSSSELLFVY